jgi:hypothetical protein
MLNRSPGTPALAGSKHPLPAGGAWTVRRVGDEPARRHRTMSVASASRAMVGGTSWPPSNSV